MIQDWIVTVTAELEQSLRRSFPTLILFDEDLRSLVVKHCPFKPNVAYMPVPRMGRALSETYARDPTFYGATFCVQCNAHFPVGEFTWSKDGEIVGS